MCCSMYSATAWWFLYCFQSGILWWGVKRSRIISRWHCSTERAHFFLYQEHTHQWRSITIHWCLLTVSPKQCDVTSCCRCYVSLTGKLNVFYDGFWYICKCLHDVSVWVSKIVIPRNEYGDWWDPPQRKAIDDKTSDWCYKLLVWSRNIFSFHRNKGSLTDNYFMYAGMSFSLFLFCAFTHFESFAEILGLHVTFHWTSCSCTCAQKPTIWTGCQLVL